MNINEYKKNHHQELKAFLVTPAGSNLMQVIASLRPEFVTNGQPHQHHESAGAVRQHLSLFNLIFSLSNPPPPDQEVEMNYGVTKKKE